MIAKLLSAPMKDRWHILAAVCLFLLQIFLRHFLITPYAHTTEEGGKQMQDKLFDELFKKIRDTTGIKDIGYHEIKDGRLKPIYKTKTTELDEGKWKNIHAHNIVYIKEHQILVKIVEEKKSIAISDVSNNELSSKAFFLFGINSILVVPVIENEIVKGIICIASIGQFHDFTFEEQRTCEALVQNYMGGEKCTSAGGSDI